MTRSPRPSTYDDDFYAWVQEQAAALRRLPGDAAGDMVDVAHLAQEIEDLGKRDLREVASNLARLVEHLIEIDSAPTSLDVAHWLSEAAHFRGSAADAFSPSMRQPLDIEKIWQRGRDRAELNLRVSGQAVAAPARSPFSLDDIFSDPSAIDRALERLKKAR